MSLRLRVKFLKPLEGGLDCGGMVAVIVHKEYAPRFAYNFRAPPGPGKFFQGLPHFFFPFGSPALPEFLFHQNAGKDQGGGGIQYAVFSRYAQGELGPPFA